MMIIRQNNMVVFNFSDSSATLPEEQFKDCKIIKNLIITRIKLDPKDVINIYQLDNKYPNKIWPILIKTKSEKPSGIQSKQQQKIEIFGFEW